MFLTVSESSFGSAAGFGLRSSVQTSCLTRLQFRRFRDVASGADFNSCDHTANVPQLPGSREHAPARYPASAWSASSCTAWDASVIFSIGATSTAETALAAAEVGTGCGLQRECEEAATAAFDSTGAASFSGRSVRGRFLSELSPVPDSQEARAGAESAMRKPTCAEPAGTEAAYAFCISWSSEIADSLPSRATETAVHRDAARARSRYGFGGGRHRYGHVLRLFRAESSLLPATVYLNRSRLASRVSVLASSFFPRAFRLSFHFRSRGFASETWAQQQYFSVRPGVRSMLAGLVSPTCVAAVGASRT